MRKEAGCSVSVRVALWLFFLPLALDFRGEDDGGGLFQAALFFSTAASGLYLMIMRRPNAHFAVRAEELVGASLVWSFVDYLYWSIDFGNYFRACMPLLLCVQSAFVVRGLSSSPGALAYCLGVIRVAGVVSVIWSFLYGVSTSFGDLQAIRYKIISPAILFTYSIFVLEFFWSRGRRRMIALIATMCIMSIILLSATRSLALGAVLITFFGAAVVSGSPLALLRLGVGSLLAVAAFGFMAEVLFPDTVEGVFEIWSGRLNSSELMEVDLTTATRIAEIKGQLELLFSGWDSLFMGRGVGSWYSWAGLEFEEVRSILRGEPSGSESFQPGHNFWVNSVYSLGLIFGSILPLVLLERFLGATHRAFKAKGQGEYISVLASVWIFSVLCFSIGGNPMGARYSGLLVGVAIALAGIQGFRGSAR